MCEERAIYLGLVAAGALPVAGWLARGGAAGAGIAVSLAMVVAGIVGLVAGLRRRSPRLPRATLRP